MYYEDPKTGKVVVMRNFDRVRNSVNEQAYNFEMVSKAGTDWQKKNAATQLKLLGDLRYKLARLIPLFIEGNRLLRKSKAGGLTLKIGRLIRGRKKTKKRS